MKSIEKIELERLHSEDYKILQDLMIKCYPRVQDPAWTKKQIKKLTTLFPDGQVVIKVDGKMVACALAIIIDYNLFDDETHLSGYHRKRYVYHTQPGWGYASMGLI
jgi:hypothetical protein